MSLDAHGVPIRRGVPRQFTFDVDAIELLGELHLGSRPPRRHLTLPTSADGVHTKSWSRSSSLRHSPASWSRS